MGDTTGKDTAALAEKEEEITELKGKLEKSEGRVQNAEKKFAEWGQELGEIRKSKEDLKTLLSEAQGTITELKKAVEARTVTPEGQAGHDSGQKPPEKPEDIEKALTDEQRKVGEDAFVALSDEEKVRYANDPAFKAEFLKRLQTSAPAIPKSPWSTAPEAERKGKKSGVDAILDRVFAKKRKASYAPEGPRSGLAPPQGGEDRPDFVEDSRVH